MKKIRIKEGYVALVFKQEKLIKVLSEGSYWLRFGEDYSLFNLKDRFSTSYDLDILLKNKELSERLHVIEIKDSELYLKYDKGVFKQVLANDVFAYWKETTDYSFLKVDLTKVEVTEGISRTVLSKLVSLGVVREHVVGIHEVGLLFTDGEFKGELLSGTHYFWKNEQTVLARNVDVRKQRIEVNGQEILTQDKANLRINLEAIYQVIDVQKAVLEAREYERQLYSVIQMAARSIIGSLTFDDLMIKKEEVSTQLLSAVKDQVSDLGVALSSLGVKDIVLPGEMKDIMNQVLVAQKKAQANVIMRREETASTRSMLNTAKLMEDNPMLFKLKEMEYVEKIAERIDSISVSGGGKVIGQLKEIFT